ncbi:chemotaxis protein CheX [Dethiosulfatarculus sandiegensis]|uniref:Chemotaxis protein X n=1 Tax=Dethiosulfatarculus sandiegensis TaxID=1429043 RepID=A0A0D2HZB5_9BACT|nr:chemotaxis protein CheX [Dethiosulfatarculus sandiegensis]KIX15593.1 chemotaxis protein X [Dethiosulfatarculus sandiegensis]
MDVRYINPFLSGAMEVLNTMGGVSLQPGKPYIKKNAKAMGDVSGIIGISGEAVGSLSVSFTFGLIKAVMKNMLGDDITQVDDDVRDAVGEITNMISGSARRVLSDEGLSLKAGIPSIVDGKDHTIKHLVSNPTLVIPFDSPDGKVVVEVCMDS